MKPVYNCTKVVALKPSIKIFQNIIYCVEANLFVWIDFIQMCRDNRLKTEFFNFMNLLLFIIFCLDL